MCLLVALVIDRIAAEVIDAAPTNESARPDCSKYLSFLEAWQSGNTSSEWDPRRLNTNHLKGCTEPDAPRRQLATPQRLRVSFNGPGASSIPCTTNSQHPINLQSMRCKR